MVYKNINNIGRLKQYKAFILITYYYIQIQLIVAFILIVAILYGVILSINIFRITKYRIF